jgi:iron complex outermembrane receptor protein
MSVYSGHLLAMKSVATLLLVQLLPLAAFAQHVRGTITDPAGRPAADVNVLLLNAADSSLRLSALSDGSGRYELNGPGGALLLRIQAIGFEAQQTALNEDSTANIERNIRLVVPATGLAGVTVSGQKPFIEAKPGMMVVNVENNPVNAGSNALELLQRSPGVRIDQDGAVLLKGRSGVEVYVDGRPARLSGEQLTAYLRSMTAEEVAALELITQPPAKYEAAGSAGIINIRTRTIRKRGLNAALSGSLAQATQMMGNLSGRITYRHDKLTVYASEYFNYVDNYNLLRVNRKFASTAGTQGNLLTEQEVRYNSRFHRVKAGAEYAVDSKTSVGLRMSRPFGNPVMAYHALSTVYDAPTNSYTYTTGDRLMRNNWTEKEYGLLARRRFQDESELTLDAYTVRNQGADGGVFYNTTSTQPATVGIADNWYMQFPVDVRLNVAQLDYNRVLGKKFKFESGVKHHTADVDFNSNFHLPDAAGNFVPDTARSNRFLYNEQISAAYVSLSREIGKKLQLQAGLRAEHTHSQGAVEPTKEAFDRNYTSLFPTAFATYTIDSTNSMTFSYGRRLDRPNYFMLNPARNYIDKYTYAVGNPYLQPQFMNNFELGYSWNGKLTATLSATKTSGVISDFFVQDDKTKTAYEVHDNLAGYFQGGISVNYNTQFFPWWSFNGYADYYLNRFSGVYFGQDYVTRGQAFTANITNQFKLGSGWETTLSGWFNGPARSTVFTQSAEMGSLDAAVSRKMLHDSLIVKLAFTDILGTQRYYGSNKFANFDTDVYSTWDARRAVLSLNYNFGKTIDLMQQKEESRRL